MTGPPDGRKSIRNNIIHEDSKYNGKLKKRRFPFKPGKKRHKSGNK